MLSCGLPSVFSSASDKTKTRFLHHFSMVCSGFKAWYNRQGLTMLALTRFIVDNSSFMNIYCILIIIRCSIQINICCRNQSNCSHLRVLRVFKEKRKRGEIKPKLIVGERIKTIPGFVTCFFTIKRHWNGKKNRDIKRSI